MRKLILYGCAIALFCGMKATAQSMHFSQYYNAPQLLNAANTALMPDFDYRLGANYRNQWAALPVPYTTFSAFGDLKIGGGSEGNKWFGLGGAIFNDKAGGGDLSLLQMQLSLAYHLHVSRNSMLSLGLSGGYSQRSVDMNKLTFDNQWDGLSFNTHLPTGEQGGLMKTTFMNVGAGINYAYIPNEALYVKIGLGVTNINQPVETFYGGSNQLGMRPTANVDVFMRTGENLIVNPSLYYTTQKGASEMVGGSMVRINMAKPGDPRPSQLILGAYYRLQDAVIGTLGYQYGGMQFVASYDLTASSLSPYNGSYGALEFSILYGGNYSKNQGATKKYACPRFN